MVRLRAFSLIELLGVLAVMAILAAAILPNIIRRVDRATWERETSDLKAMADGLVKTILRDKQIANQAGLPTAIAKYLDLSLDQVTTTPRRFTRRFLVDPNLKVNGKIPSTLPYNQGSSGSAGQTSARIMILSAIAGPEVSTITESFSTIWNTPDGSKPSSWTGKGEDLCIQRVELGGLFHKLSLLNVDTNSTHLAYFKLETNATVFVPTSGGQANIYLLHGTALNLYSLHDTNSLQKRVIVNQDESFVFQNDRWGQGLTQDQPDLTLTPGSFGDWVSRFLSADAPPSGLVKFGSTQRAVVDEFYNYMWDYWSWGEQSFTTYTGETSASPQNPFFRAASDSQVRLDSLSAHLIGK